MELGARFWLRLVGVCFAIGIGGLLIFLIIGTAWYAWGAFGALIFFFLLLLAVGYVYDRTHAKSYDDAAT